MSKAKVVDWVEYTGVNAGVTRDRERVVTEFSLSIIVNGRHLTTAIITPMMEKEFVIGHLFGRGVIDGIADIKSITVKGNTARVALSGQGSEAARPAEMNFNFRVSPEAIFRGVGAILKSKIYAVTEAAHSAGLFRAGAEPVCIAEDIGRHNALDKVIGYALMNGVDLTSTFAASTGRMVSDMVSKICRANIPVVATKTAVTRLGVEMGQDCGLTIIGFVRDQGAGTAAERGMKIYTNPQRIIC